MESSKSNRNVLIYSLLLFIGFAGYYEVMRLTDLYTNTYLRTLNFVIEFGIVYWMLKKIHDRKDGLEMRDMIQPLRASFYAVLAFSAVIMLYLHFDQKLLAAVQEASPYGTYLSPFAAFVLLFTEGMLGAGIATFCNYYLLGKKQHAEVRVSESA